MFKRTLSLILALLLTVVCIGCVPTTPPSDTTEGDNTTEAPIVPIELDAETLAQYTIIRPEGVLKGDLEIVVNAAVKLRTEINTSFGITMGILDDWVKNVEEIPTTAKEIVVGITNRPETANALALLRDKDYAITFENERIIITGKSANATAKAVDYFLETYVNKTDKKVVLSANLVDVVRYDYILPELSINGVSLSEYTIVYPENCDLITYSVALALSDYFNNNAGLEIAITSDSAAETEYELLVGDTNRSASNTGVALTDQEYSLSISGKKVVMKGSYYMAGAAASALINDYMKSDEKTLDVTNIPTTATPANFTFKEAKNAIMLIGDGMSQIHIDAAVDTGKISEFVAEKLPYKAECTTFSQSVSEGKSSYTDSAASATALATGIKTYNDYLGVDKNNNPIKNIRELAHEFGCKTAVVTTDAITGATPCGYLAHHNNRDASTVLKQQINELEKNNKVDYLAASMDTALTAKTREALSVISEDGSNFFIMIEEAYIDKHSHNNLLDKTTNSVKNYNEVIAYCIAFTMLHPDTVIVITADHDCGNLSKKANGEYVYNSSNHTNKNVPVFAMGSLADELLGGKKTIDNTDIPKCLAQIYGSTNFGQ